MFKTFNFKADAQENLAIIKMLNIIEILRLRWLCTENRKIIAIN